MTFKKIKEGKEICHGEVISKEDFLEVFDRLVKIRNDMKNWGKAAKSHKKKYREENDTLNAEIEKLKLENIDLKTQIHNFEVFTNLGKTEKYLI